jgi:hypothetical protein
MKSSPFGDPVPPKQSGFDPGLKCIAAVFLFTAIARVALSLANKTGSRTIADVAFIGVFFGLIALIAASCVVWSRRATSPRPARRWALMVAVGWASIQILVDLMVVLQMFSR